MYCDGKCQFYLSEFVTFPEKRLSDGPSGKRRACSFLWTATEPTLGKKQLNTWYNRLGNPSIELKTCRHADLRDMKR